MRLTIDLDNSSFTRMMKKLKLLKKMFPNSRISVWKSSSGRGWHLIVHGLPITFEELIQHRIWLGDDARRIQLDYIREKKGICYNVLFDKKGDKYAVKYS